MAEVSYNYDKIIANIKPYRGYDDFIHSITVQITAADQVNSITTIATLELNVAQEFTDDEPYVPFEQWSQEKVLGVINPLVESRGIKNALATKLKIQATKPQPKNFNFS